MPQRVETPQLAREIPQTRQRMLLLTVTALMRPQMAMVTLQTLTLITQLLKTAPPKMIRLLPIKRQLEEEDQLEEGGESLNYFNLIKRLTTIAPMRPSQLLIQAMITPLTLQLQKQHLKSPTALRKAAPTLPIKLQPTLLIKVQPTLLIKLQPTLPIKLQRILQLIIKVTLIQALLKPAIIVHPT